MSATAVVMIALLVHLGSAGLDSSSTATISRYEETVRTISWDATVSMHRDVYRFYSPERVLTVQRMRDADLVYAVVAARDSDFSRDTDTVGIVSFTRIRDRLGTVSQTGAGVIALTSILYAWEGPVVVDEPDDDPADTRDPILHYRWSPGEITVAMPERNDLFILQYR